MKRGRIGSFLSTLRLWSGRGDATKSRPGAKVSEARALAEALLSSRGEASGVLVAQRLLNLYGTLEESDRASFLAILVDRFGVDNARLTRAIFEFQETPNATTGMRVHTAAEPRRQELLRRINLAPNGTGGLVRMRVDLLKFKAAYAVLDVLDADFVHLFSSWFNRGFLELRRIDWSTPANILECIIRYEAVHEIQGWDDLRRRLEPSDRRCFAFFHPALTDEPLIFVEVALTKGIPDSIDDVLSSNRVSVQVEKANTAVFYSISNCQTGLKGISFGNFLIKQVVEELKRELPRIDTFVTLSPVPGFAGWLRKERKSKDSRVFSVEELMAFEHLDKPDWHLSAPAPRALGTALLRAAAHYIVTVKGENGRAMDPVSRFHLGNGARLERINWVADTSTKGLHQAHGIMVNYLYDLGDIGSNHERFVNSGEVVSSRVVRRLLAGRAKAS